MLRRPKRPGEIAAALGIASGAAASYLDRLRDVIIRDDDERWRIADPMFALWRRWRASASTSSIRSCCSGWMARLLAAEDTWL